MTRGKERQRAEETQDSGSLRVGFLQKLWCRRTPHLRRGEQCQAAAPRSWENTWGRGSRGPNRRPLLRPTLCLCSTWAAGPICALCKQGLPTSQEGRVRRPISTSTGAHHKGTASTGVSRATDDIGSTWSRIEDSGSDTSLSRRQRCPKNCVGRCSARLRSVLIKPCFVFGGRRGRDKGTGGLKWGCTEKGRAEMM